LPRKACSPLAIGDRDDRVVEERARARSHRARFFRAFFGFLALAALLFAAAAPCLLSAMVKPFHALRATVLRVFEATLLLFSSEAR